MAIASHIRSFVITSAFGKTILGPPGNPDPEVGQGTGVGGGSRVVGAGHIVVAAGRYLRASWGRGVTAMC